LDNSPKQHSMCLANIQRQVINRSAKSPWQLIPPCGNYNHCAS
jgi:hypothetical protein